MQSTISAAAVDDAVEEGVAGPAADSGNNQPVTITALKTSWIKLSETLFTRQM